MPKIKVLIVFIILFIVNILVAVQLDNIISNDMIVTIIVIFNAIVSVFATLYYWGKQTGTNPLGLKKKK